MIRELLLVTVVILAGCSAAPGVSDDGIAAGGEDGSSDAETALSIIEQTNETVIVELDASAKVNGSTVEYVLLVDAEGETVDASLAQESGEFELTRDGTEVSVAVQNEYGDRETVELERL